MDPNPEVVKSEVKTSWELEEEGPLSIDEEFEDDLASFVAQVKPSQSDFWTEEDIHQTSKPTSEETELEELACSLHIVPKVRATSSELQETGLEERRCSLRLVPKVMATSSVRSLSRRARVAGKPCFTMSLKRKRPRETKARGQNQPQLREREHEAADPAEQPVSRVIENRSQTCGRGGLTGGVTSGADGEDENVNPRNLEMAENSKAVLWSGSNLDLYSEPLWIWIRISNTDPDP